MVAAGDRARWSVALPVALAIAVFLPALGGGLVWDDRVNINSDVGSIDSLAELLRPPPGAFVWGGLHYRPIPAALHLAEYRLFGYEATFEPHLTNLILHVLCTLQVWMLCRRIVGDRHDAAWAATAGASLFAVHPIHSEAVAWISGRHDLLVTTFALAAVLSVDRLRRDSAVWWPVVVAPLWYLLALGSKETGVALLVLLPAWLFLVPTGGEPRVPIGRGRAMGLAAGLVLTTGAYLVLRQLAGIATGARWAADTGESVVRLVRSLGYYVVKSVVPVPQTHYVELSHLPSGWVSLVVLLAVAVGAFAAIRTGRRIWLPGIVVFAVSLAPSLLPALMLGTESPAAERYLYLPTVGCSLLVAAAATVFRRRVILTVVALVCVLFAVASFRRAGLWADDVRLWQDAVNKAPAAGLPMLSLGRAYEEAGEPDRALECYLAALERSYDEEGYARANNNAGVQFLIRDRLDDAERHFVAAVRNDPGLFDPYYGLGVVHFKQAVRSPDPLAGDRMLVQGIGHLDVATRLRPNHGRAWGYLGASWIARGVLAEQRRDGAAAAGHYERGIEVMQHARQIAPDLEVNGETPDSMIAMSRQRIAAVRGE